MDLEGQSEEEGMATLAMEEGGSGGRSSDAEASKEVGRCFKRRPGRVKITEEEQGATKIYKRALYAQAKATKAMAIVQMKKTVLLEDQNILMTMPDTEITTPKAKEYLKLCRIEELKKLKQHLAKEEERKVAVEREHNKMVAQENQWQRLTAAELGDVGGVGSKPETSIFSTHNACSLMKQTFLGSRLPH